MSQQDGRNGYDVIVIGAGPAGEHCAAVLAKGGLEVAIVERELVGGECDYWACIPSKTLLRPGEALQCAREAPGAREAIQGELVPAAALEWRDFMVGNYEDEGKAKWLADNGITLLRGTGRITGPGTIEVDGDAHRTEHIVIATGSDPVIPQVDGLRETNGIWTNREVTGMKEPPRRLIALGGGPVGVEMAQALARMGTSVALVEGMDHLLPREPRPLGEALAEALVQDGIELHLGRHAERVRQDGGEYVVDLPDGAELRGDRLLVATGRRPRTGEIGLENLGLELGDRGEVPVDDHLSAGERVWAIGDVTNVWPLTYVGKYQGRVVASNILGAPRRANFEAVPRVVFTDPQAASVGAAGGPFEAKVPLKHVPRTATFTRAYAEDPGFMTLISDGERITGAYALGPDAGEWLQQATLAIRARVPLTVMNDTIQPFPTFSEIFLHALTELADRVPAAA